jgi:hypothetical protein
MTERDVRRRVVWASVVFVSALTFAASYLVVTEVDRPRERARVSVPTNERVASAQPPVPGLVPPAAPRRRVVTVRRTRAS